jgi:hypothetical protein
MSIKPMTKVCGAAAVVALLVFAALGPAKWQLRTGLGWQFDHIVGYFAFTLMFCLAWPRPRVVGGALIAFAMLLEGLQALTPDRHADLLAALISATGVLSAALPADLFFRAPRRLNGRTLLMLQRFRLRWPSGVRGMTPQLAALAGLVCLTIAVGVTAGLSLKNVSSRSGIVVLAGANKVEDFAVRAIAESW